MYLFYENYDKPDRPLPYSEVASPLIAEPQGTMQLYAQSEFTNGNIGWVQDSGVDVVWSIERTYDEDGVETESQIARVERDDGVVHALGQGNGSIVVRCQASKYDVHADMKIAVKGNSGVPYITDLQICDENGTAYENDAEIRVESADFGLERHFYVNASYHDPITGEDFVKKTKDGDTVEGIMWTTSGDSKVAYVNEDTGVFIAQATGSVRLTCSVPGAGKLGDTATDFVFVLCGGDTLDPDRDYNPAEELKVVVKYATEDKQGIGGESDYEIARTWYYSPTELESLGVTENLYTLVKASGSWGTMKARGVYFERLIDDVVNSDDFSLSMVKGFYFGATDNYNPGFVGASWLFDNQRYYYPNMSVGAGNLGAVGVAPMIATETVQEDLVDAPTGEYSSQTRFRLCMGAESTTTNNAQQSIYNIYQITIILNDAPPVGWDEPTNGRDSAQKAEGAKEPREDQQPGSESKGEDIRQEPPEQPQDETREQQAPEDGKDQETPPEVDRDQTPPAEIAEKADSDKPSAGAEDEQQPDPHAGESDNVEATSVVGRSDESRNAQNGSDVIDSAPRDESPRAEQNTPGDPAAGTAAQDDDAANSPQDEAAPEGARPSDVPSAQDLGEPDAVETPSRDAATPAPQADGNGKPEQRANDPIEALAGDEKHRWQVYEMMSAQPALFEALAIENPLAPFVAPFLAVTALAGGAYSGIWFRREMRPPSERAWARDGGTR